MHKNALVKDESERTGCSSGDARCTGVRIKAERENLAMSQADFAQYGGVAKRTQIMYEKGDRSPSAEYLKGIFKAGADINYIITGNRDRCIVPGNSDVGVSELDIKSDTNNPVMDWNLFFYIMEELTDKLETAKLNRSPMEIAKFARLVYSEAAGAGENSGGQQQIADHEIQKTLAVLLAVNNL